jgi:hypothetical protein
MITAEPVWKEIIENTLNIFILFVIYVLYLIL